jgi:hypothetical protein
MIGKIKPTIAIRAEVRPLFPEIEFIECTSVFFANLYGYEIRSRQKLHPAVAEGEFTPLDFSYIRRSENEKVKRRGSADYPRYST